MVKRKRLFLKIEIPRKRCKFNEEKPSLRYVSILDLSDDLK